jgi:tetratricopeptide (TPR) repeat protein
MSEVSSTAISDSVETVGPNPADHSASGLRRRRRRMVMICLLAAVPIVLGLSQAYSTWRAFRAGQYRDGCQKFVAERDWPRLLACARQWRNWDGVNSAPLLFEAEACVQLDRKEEAVSAILSVDDHYPGALEALTIAGDIQFGDLNRPFDAEATWNRMLKINERADLPYQRLIYLHAMLLERGKMRQLIRQAMELQCEPQESFTYLIQSDVLNFTDGRHVMARWARTTPDSERIRAAEAVYLAKNNSTNTVRTFGPQAVASGDRSIVDELRKKYPENIELLAFQIEYAMGDGQIEGVGRLLENLPAATAEDGRFWRYRGWYLTQTRDLAAAEESLRRAVELNPFDWRARLDLSTCLRALKRTDESKEFSRVSILGKALERRLFEAPNARDLPPEVVEKVQEYIEAVGDPLPIARLHQRLR